MNLHDSHVLEYLRRQPMVNQFKACDKVWKSFSKGKMTEDQAVLAWYRTIQKHASQMKQFGLLV
jgi:hypothetical protein